MATAIDIGSAASNRSTYQAISWLGNYYTYVERGNVANADGILNSCEIWMQSTGANIRVGTFSASGANLTRRDYEVLGSVTSGSKQTFTGLNITVAANDLIGTTGTGGNIEGDATGSSVYHAKEGSQNYTFWDTSAHSYSDGNGPISLYGTGFTAPDAPTNVAATENQTTKVTITWTAGTGETDGHVVYRDGVDCSGVIAHGTNTFDDTNADAPATLAGGTADASDGTETAKVVLSVSGQGVNHGTSHSYTVKAINAVGNSAASTADVGYRISTETLTYQWYRSAADSDADYSAIDGGTTNPYNDTGAP